MGKKICYNNYIKYSGGIGVRILHTADWHIGKKLQRISLLEDQEYIINQIINQIEKYHPELLIIAGDLYDKSIPSKEATHLLQQALSDINIKHNLPIVAISGNHDNRERLSVGKAWFSQHNFYLHTTLEQSFKKITFDNVDMYLLPYFEPYEAREYFNDNTLDTHHKATKRVIDEIYSTMNEKNVNILVAHTFVAGSLETDSEREISVGTVENVAVDVFEKFDYVALGHLHNPNACNEEKIKYSGSPLAYSFSEAKQTKGTRLINITKNSFEEQFLPLEPLRKLYNVVADYNEVMTKEFQNNFNFKHDFFSMELSGLDGITDPMPRIQAMYPNTLLLKKKTKKENSEKESLTKEMLSKTPLELIENFYKEEVSVELTDIQKKTLENIFKVVNSDETN
ncbi:exonuclease SbcCD, D subunit [Gemella bergeri ATCC 700627]|uniref:Nuclease SbcCD subunit D n=1 Tax=Gemella bergeri ATCC 700627 TaxID=1321820 RepID=U2QM87_9BACL|nr:exonuclease SbcCD, D subunit [Gemella bergeri ATCC 700627]